MANATYDEHKFTFELRDDGTRLVYRPNEVLIRHEGDAAKLTAAFAIVNRPPRLVDGDSVVPDLRVNVNWGVITLAKGQDPKEIVQELKGQKIMAQLNHVYFIGTLTTSGRKAPNYAAPNYAVPNYAVPNYAVPNYAVPNYAVPNYAVPNYAVPNYAVPNYAVPNYAVPNYAVPNYAVPNYAVPNYAVPNYAVPNHGIGGSCGREACPQCVASPQIPPAVPEITARASSVPLQALQSVKSAALEIHVLDVRPQIKIGSTQNVVKETWVNDQVAKQTVKEDLIGRPGALLPKALFLHDEITGPSHLEGDPNPADFRYQELRTLYVEEPFSDGLGSDFNSDAIVDPATNHAVFIKGVIDRLLQPGEGESFVHAHSVAGSLGDVSDADLVKALEHVAEDSKDRALANGSQNVVRIMSLSIAGYPEIDESDEDCLAETIRNLHDKEGWNFVASAGNDASCRPTRPASLPDVVSVAAYGPGGPAWFSNFGTWVDACAPGVDVVSDFPNIEMAGLSVNERLKADDEFKTLFAAWSGTSFSAPFVAAMLARWMVANSQTFNEAVDELILHSKALHYPGYGTIVSFRKQRTEIVTDTAWI